MATSDEPDGIVDFTNVASCTKENGGKWKHGASYSTEKTSFASLLVEMPDACGGVT